MTPNKVIETIDRLKPNVYTDEDKYDWIYRLDDMIARTVYEKEPAPAVGADEELPVPAPWDDIYGLYVASMIDFYNREYGHYNNSVMMFQERLEQYRAWYIRNHMPKGADNFRNVMG